MGVFTRSRAGSILGGIAVVGVSAVFLAGCAGDSGGGSGSTEPGESLDLKIGTALPVTGNLAFLGPPEIAGTEFAKAEINAADMGIQVELIQGDSGDTDNKAYETEIPRLLGEGVSAIIGAASSGVSLQFIDQVVGADVIQFSPANTSAAFTTYDDNGLYFRTAPSDILQGEVLGNLIAESGAQTLGMIVLNDSYGTGLAEFVTEAFEAAGGEVVAAPTYNTGDTNFSAQVSEVVAANPDAIALITFDEIYTIIPALKDAGFDTSKVYLVDGNLKQFGEDLPAASLTGAKGTTPGPVLADNFQQRLNDVYSSEFGGTLEDYSYAAESYDAVILIALAALAAGSSDAPAIATKLQEVSGGSGNGTKCTSFAECAQIIIDGGVADFDGASGPVTFDEAGDPTEATIGIFQYGDDNMHTRIN